MNNNNNNNNNNGKEKKYIDKLYMKYNIIYNIFFFASLIAFSFLMTIVLYEKNKNKNTKRKIKQKFYKCYYHI